MTGPRSSIRTAALAQRLVTELIATVEQSERLDAADLPEMVDAATGPALQAVRDAIAGARAEATRQTTEIEGWRAERATIAAERDQAPPPFAARTAGREGRPGAPFWATVDFADAVDEATAAAIEAALHAANLLDAWVPAAAGADGDNAFHTNRSPGFRHGSPGAPGQAQAERSDTGRRPRRGARRPGPGPRARPDPGVGRVAGR